MKPLLYYLLVKKSFRSYGYAQIFGPGEEPLNLTRRWYCFMRFAILYSFLITLLVNCTEKTTDSTPAMNVILIVTDDQGYGDLAFHGNPEIETPQLDQLAMESAEFTRFYVSPVCAPTRASLLTGRYHLRTGTSWVTHRKEVMRSEEVTLAEVFKENGYTTGLFGKWHNGKQYPS